MTNVSIAKKYREKHGWEMPTLKLARIMYKENNLRFSTLDNARSTLRAIENKTKKTKIYERLPDRPKNPYNLPESDETVYEPFKIKGVSRLLVLSDIHIPYHSIEAITTALDYAKNEKPDGILLNGDTLDFFGLSRYAKEPGKRSFAHELLAFKQFFEILKKEFNCKIFFKLGNHEERYNHFLWMKAGELDGVDEFKLEEIIKARAEGIEVIGDKRIIHAGKLDIVHGHEFGGSVFSPVNIARGLFLKAKVSAMQGHNHQTSEHTESNMNGEITTTWSLGCLSELHPAYLPINKWNHGFAIVDIENDGDFQVRNKRIFKGRVL
jgi:predicted phosphodiesterase